MRNRDSRTARLVACAASALVALAALISPAAALAQELEPRAYFPTPVGTNFLLVAWSYQTGEILFDPSLLRGGYHVFEVASPG